MGRSGPLAVGASSFNAARTADVTINVRMDSSLDITVQRAGALRILQSRQYTCRATA